MAAPWLLTHYGHHHMAALQNHVYETLPTVNMLI
jgi:hypothetical protein